MAEKKRKALGRGLSALLGDAQEDYAQSAPAPAAPSTPEPAAVRVPPPPSAAPYGLGPDDEGCSLPNGDEPDVYGGTNEEITEEITNRARGVHVLHMVAIERIAPGTAQPRTVFDEGAIKALAASIKRQGILAPLIVRENTRKNADADYEIISGERRWRAAQLAQLHRVPAVIRNDLEHNAQYEAAVIENLQRENLTDIEEAVAYGRMLSEYSHTQKSIAEVVGKSRAHVANTLRLLKLPLEVIRMIERGDITAGHGRVLLSVPDLGDSEAEKLARRFAKDQTSVRSAENQVKALGRRASAGGSKKTGRAGKTGRGGAADNGGADTAAIEKRLQASLGLDVKISMRGAGGAVTIAFDDLDQFDGLLETLSRGLAKSRRMK